MTTCEPKIGAWKERRVGNYPSKGKVITVAIAFCLILILAGLSVYVFGYGIKVDKEQLSYTRSDGVVGTYTNTVVKYRYNNGVTNNTVVDWLIGIR